MSYVGCDIFLRNMRTEETEVIRMNGMSVPRAVKEAKKKACEDLGWGYNEIKANPLLSEADWRAVGLNRLDY